MLGGKVAEIKRHREEEKSIWIFTKHGLFSAVCARKGNGKHGQPVDPDRIMVRGRLRSLLKALQVRDDRLNRSANEVLIFDSSGFPNRGTRRPRL